MGCRRGGGRGGLGAVPARGRHAAPRVRIELLERIYSKGFLVDEFSQLKLETFPFE